MCTSTTHTLYTNLSLLQLPVVDNINIQYVINAQFFAEDRALLFCGFKRLLNNFY